MKYISISNLNIGDILYFRERSSWIQYDFVNPGDEAEVIDKGIFNVDLRFIQKDGDSTIVTYSDDQINLHFTRVKENNNDVEIMCVNLNK